MRGCGEDRGLLAGDKRMIEGLLAICTALGGISAVAYFVEKAFANRLSRIWLSSEPTRQSHVGDVTPNQEIHEAGTNITGLADGAAHGSEPAARAFTTSMYRVWTQPLGQTELVKVGWSWPAYLFGVFWALTKRMPVVAGAVALISGVGAYATDAAGFTGDDNLWYVVVASQVLGFLLGAFGNTLRERNLSARGFSLRGITLRVHPVYGPVVAGLSAMRTSRRLRAVIVWALLGLSLGTGAYFLLRSPDDQSLDALVRTQLIRNCDRAILTGTVDPRGSETFAWFEWGETPELGRTTVKQRFREKADFYQHLVNLRENTTYYSKVVVENPYGRTDTSVRAFRTPPCDR